MQTPGVIVGLHRRRRRRRRIRNSRPSAHNKSVVVAVVEETNSIASLLIHRVRELDVSL